MTQKGPAPEPLGFRRGGPRIQRLGLGELWRAGPRQSAACNGAAPININGDANRPAPRRAIRASLPAGSVVYPPERNGRGEYLLWLTEAEANRLAALRRRGESYRDAVIRLAKHAQD